VHVGGGIGYKVYEGGEITSQNGDLDSKALACGGDNSEEFAKAHFSIWRQKNRVRVYINETKILDLPYGLPTDYAYNMFRFKTAYMNFASTENEDEFMVSNIRYAVGAPDTRSKLITEGKLVSRGILFNVNSDEIKAESYGTIKEIAKVLQENPTIQVKIIGHTDADGEVNSNLELSKKRAESVKRILISEFQVDGNRLTTDGKGESEPSDSNDTTVGKANNRRVEFVKL
jgi:OOP family OmpA-OmpF porin